MKERKIKMSTEQEQKRLIAAAESDPDNPPASDEELANAVHARDVPEKAARMARRFRGPQKAPKKIRTTISLDPDVIAFFKTDGDRGWQSRVNAALREVAGLE